MLKLDRMEKMNFLNNKTSLQIIIFIEILLPDKNKIEIKIVRINKKK